MLTVPLATSVAVPAVIFVGCLVVGVLAATRWVPELPAGTIGGIVFFVVCGMAGAAVAVVGVNVFLMVESGRFIPGGSPTVIAGYLSEMSWEVGLLLGVATLLYLVALRIGPQLDELASDRRAEPPSPGEAEDQP